MLIRTATPLLFFVSIALLSSCNNYEKEKLRAENDSLRHELDNRHSMVVIMSEVKSMLDSIDENRNILHADLNEGTTYENVTERLGSINDYVKKTEQKLTTIENDLKTSQHENSAYEMLVHALKEELHLRSDEVHKLEKAVTKYKKENTGLIQTVKLQEDQMTDLKGQVTTKQQELALLQAKVDELIENFKVTEAEAYYARARSVEDAARKTRLAPHKKRETYREALELYQKSLSLGKTEAQANIDALAKKVGH
jgi:uncharacterized coiled-coil protein SlyX